MEVRTRSFISPAALRVKVMAKISLGLTFLPCSKMCKKRSTSTRVLPLPAPALTATLLSMVVMACNCWSVKLLISFTSLLNNAQTTDIFQRTIRTAFFLRLYSKIAIVDTLHIVLQ